MYCKPSCDRSLPGSLMLLFPEPHRSQLLEVWNYSIAKRFASLTFMHMVFLAHHCTPTVAPASAIKLNYLAFRQNKYPGQRAFQNSNGAPEYQQVMAVNGAQYQLQLRLKACAWCTMCAKVCLRALCHEITSPPHQFAY